MATLLGSFAPILAGGTPEHAVLIVDPASPESLHVANHYREARDLPDANVLFFAPTPNTYAEFASVTSEAFLGSLEQQGLAGHVDYAILPSGGSFYVAAPGLVTDSCFPVGRFSATGVYQLAFQEATILAGTSSQQGNGYYRNADDARAFDSQITWANGAPHPAGKRYYLAAMLGYTGSLGNTLAEVLDTIDRSVAADGTFPGGTVYYMQTTDLARSAPRHGAYPAAVASLLGLGGQAQHWMADLPLGQHDCLGIMTGLALPDITNANLTLLPGSFADHLTSYAGTFDNGTQTKMSRWIAKGASGTSGAVEEPCNYAGKFPHARLHVFYRQGASLGEAFFRSHGYWPFQTLFLGDPLTRPFAHLPAVAAPSMPPGPVADTIPIAPSATTSHPTATILTFDLLVDGRPHGTTTPGGHFALDTTQLADGWHELRVLAVDSSPVKSTGRWVGPLLVDNFGRAATLTTAMPSGDLATAFAFQAGASGGPVAEVVLLHGSRVVAASAGAPATLTVHGRTLGGGHPRVQLEARFQDGRRARSAPLVLDIAHSGAPTSPLPVAHGYAKRVLADQPCVVELPVTADDDAQFTFWSLPLSPAQAAVLAVGKGYAVLRPNPGASGTDLLVFQVAAPGGTSNVASVAITYEAPLACPVPANVCSTAPNSVGPGAVMDSYGSTSLGANSFVATTGGLPLSTTGIYVMGQNPTQLPLGNGFLCVDAPLRRIGAVSAGGIGYTERAFDFSAPPFAAGAFAIHPGSTWYVQLWYRNVAGGGAGFNLSDALQVTFCP